MHLTGLVYSMSRILCMTNIVRTHFVFASSKTDVKHIKLYIMFKLSICVEYIVFWYKFYTFKSDSILSNFVDGFRSQVFAHK